jgi:hypothetical protein
VSRRRVPIAKATKDDTSVRTLLEDLSITSIALVPAGADSEARIVLAKADEVVPRTFSQMNTNAEAIADWNRARWTLSDSVNSIIQAAITGEERSKLLKKTFSEFSSYCADKVPALAGVLAKSADLDFSDSDAGAVALRDLVTNTDATASISKESPAMSFDPSKLSPEAKAEFDRISKENADLRAAAPAPATTADPTSPAAIAKAKATSPEAAAAIDALLAKAAGHESAIERLSTDVKTLTDGIVKERADADAREVATLAKEIAPPKAEQAELDRLAKIISAVPKGEARDGVVAELRKARNVATLAKSGGLTEAGSSGAQAAADAGDANAKLETMAKELQAKEGISYGAAFLRVTTSERALVSKAAGGN